MAGPDKDGSDESRRLNDLWEDYERGDVDRRQFIRSAAALGISVPAAIALSDPAAAQSCEAAQARLEVRIASDYQISDAAVARLERVFETVATAAGGSSALMRPKTYKVKTKRKCVCGSPFAAPDWFPPTESSEGRL